VAGTGLGDQLNQIFASSWAAAEPAARTIAAKASAIFCLFINLPPQTAVLLKERMSQIARLHNL
jgi:hypothetical protein